MTLSFGSSMTTYIPLVATASFGCRNIHLARRKVGYIPHIRMEHSGISLLFFCFFLDVLFRVIRVMSGEQKRSYATGLLDDTYELEGSLPMYFIWSDDHYLTIPSEDSAIKNRLRGFFFFGPRKEGKSHEGIFCLSLNSQKSLPCSVCLVFGGWVGHLLRLPL